MSDITHWVIKRGKGEFGIAEKHKFANLKAAENAASQLVKGGGAVEIWDVSEMQTKGYDGKPRLVATVSRGIPIVKGRLQIPKQTMRKPTPKKLKAQTWGKMRRAKHGGYTRRKGV